MNTSPALSEVYFRKRFESDLIMGHEVLFYYKLQQQELKTYPIKDSMLYKVFYDVKSNDNFVARFVRPVDCKKFYWLVCVSNIEHPPEKFPSLKNFSSQTIASLYQSLIALSFCPTGLFFWISGNSLSKMESICNEVFNKLKPFIRTEKHCVLDKLYVDERGNVYTLKPVFKK